MNIQRARDWLAKQPEVRPGMVWTPLPICERLMMNWEAEDLLQCLAPGRAKVGAVFARQRWLRRETLAALIDEADAGRFQHWGTNEIVVVWQGIQYVIDGNHRFAVRWLAELSELDDLHPNCLTVTLADDGSLPRPH